MTPALAQRFVASADFLVAFAALFLVSQSDGLVRIYFCFAVTLFFFSAIYQSNVTIWWRYVADRVNIILFIAVTPLPYFFLLSETLFVYSLYACWIVSVVVVLAYCLGYLEKPRNLVGSLSYKVPAGLGIVALLGVSFPSLWGYLCLWLGVVIFRMQGIVFEQRWPIKVLFPIVQHLLLYLAFALHAFCALNYA